MTLSVLLDSGSVAFSVSGVSQTKLMAAGLDLSCQEVSNIVFLDVVSQQLASFLNWQTKCMMTSEPTIKSSC